MDNTLKNREKRPSLTALLRESLEAGNTENQLTMWVHFGIGNHTDQIYKLRMQYMDEGKPWNYIKTERRLVERKHGGKALIAFYHIDIKDLPRNQLDK